MSFNVDKCKVMHIGNNNPSFRYKMQGHELIVVKQEKDLGVTISNTLKVSDQCIAESKKANMMLGLISRNFDYKFPDVMKRLYLAFVRPHLEYAIQFWSPYYAKDINILERIQRRATKQIPTSRNLSYDDRLKRLNMFSPRKRRLRGDLIETFKILHGFENINPDSSLKRDWNNITRNNGMKLKGHRCNTLARKNYFNVRVVDHWNKLPPEVVKPQSISSFKRSLDKHFMNMNVY